MPRKPFICSATEPYHLTARSHNKNHFPLPIDQTWEIMSNYLYYLDIVFDVQIHSFVLMNNHFHMLATFPEANLSQAMHYFMGMTSRTISASAGQINQIYGNRVFRSRIDTYHYFCNAYKYVYRNPVEAGLCRVAEEYRYSSLHSLLGQSRLDFPVLEDTLLLGDESVRSVLNWINVQPKESDRIDIRNALRREVFKLRKINHKPHNLNFVRY